MILNIKKGQSIYNRLEISNGRIRNWKYAGDCSPMNCHPNTEFKVAEIGSTAGTDWVKLELVGSYQTMHLKITGGEFANLFKSQKG